MSTAKLYISTRENLTYNIANFNSNLSIYFYWICCMSSYFSLDYENNFNKKLQLTSKSESTRHSSNPILMDESNSVK